MRDMDVFGWFMISTISIGVFLAVVAVFSEVIVPWLGWA